MSTTPKDFTHLSAASIQTIAEAFGFVISDDVAKAFAPDVEYRLRDIIQEALKCTKRSRRNVLTTEVYFFMFLSLSLSRSVVVWIVEYLEWSALDDDDDDYSASVPKRNTFNTFLSLFPIQIYSKTKTGHKRRVTHTNVRTFIRLPIEHAVARVRQSERHERCFLHLRQRVGRE